MLEDQMRAALERRRQRSTLRSLTVLDTTARRTNLVATHDDRHPSSSSSSSRERGGAASSQGEAPPPRPLADFSSNDYLSLASSAEMREAFVGRVMSARENPLGSTGSRLLDGNSVEHEQLEHRLSTFFQSPSALFFSSGFEANVSIFSALPQAGDLIVYDELIHASVHDGMRTSRARFRVPFGHNDLGDLERVLRAFCREGAGDGKGVQLASGSTSTLSEEGDDDTHARISFAQALQRRQRNVFIAVESVYSMDGDLCPLANLVTLAERYVPRECLHIIVDEAHSTGLYGPSGRGLPTSGREECDRLITSVADRAAADTPPATIVRSSASPWLSGSTDHLPDGTAGPGPSTDLCACGQYGGGSAWAGAGGAGVG
ncbi:hypothetical protein A4X06_0g6139 [Tilletia controversa]|uniref:Aminotransferase class I/classII large domain-containing protein n=1 Tax=Tilletia controversa TaxID=13291 RepID=A0A8X7MQ73_9BASI|nr:hypothetical protein A4X06_0g6139 [Tilletia controversa]CAD6983854.1 unnamed protein product [Tilletia controversa]